MWSQETNIPTYFIVCMYILLVQLIVTVAGLELSSGYSPMGTLPNVSKALYLYTYFYVNVQCMNKMI